MLRSFDQHCLVANGKTSKMRQMWGYVKLPDLVSGSSYVSFEVEVDLSELRMLPGVRRRRFSKLWWVDLFQTNWMSIFSPDRFLHLELISISMSVYVPIYVWLTIWSVSGRNLEQNIEIVWAKLVQLLTSLVVAMVTYGDKMSYIIINI